MEPEMLISKYTYVKNTETTFTIRLAVSNPQEDKVGSVQVSSSTIKYVDFELDDGVYFKFTNAGLSGDTTLKVPVTVQYDGVFYETTVLLFGQYNPIYQDQNLGIYTQGSPVNYQLYNGYGELIFTGQSVKSPDDAFVRINVPRFIDNKLKMRIPSPSTSGWYYLDNEYVAVLYSLDDEDIKSANRYIYDWSYTTDKYTEPTFLNRFINNKFDYRSPLYISILNVLNNQDEYNYQIYRESIAPNINIGKVPAEGHYCYYIAPDTNNKRHLVRFGRGGDTIYEFDTTHCGKYTLLYVNKFGAIDSFLIENNIYQEDNYTRETYRQNVLTTENKFGEINYLTNIDTTYNFSTGYLTDEQSQIVSEHLLSSQTVWLYNNETGKSIPVNITNKSADYKKFKNGRTMINYNIELEETVSKKIKTLL